jgi:hypothetical protein
MKEKGWSENELKNLEKKLEECMEKVRKNVDKKELNGQKIHKLLGETERGREREEEKEWMDLLEIDYKNDEDLKYLKESIGVMWINRMKG